MMKITIIALGKIKENWIVEGIGEYQKRLNPYCTFSINQLPEQRIPQNPSDLEIKQVLEKEASIIIKAIPPRAVKIGLVIDGEHMSSPKLAQRISEAGQTSSEIVFIIGSSHGLSEEIENLCDIKLSFSKLTFPHQLMRLVLAEQIYRTFSIINNSSYHK